MFSLNHVHGNFIALQLGVQCNYATFIPWKYGAFKDKMPHQKFTKFYDNHILVAK
jgi:hypothetical protein